MLTASYEEWSDTLVWSQKQHITEREREGGGGGERVEILIWVAFILTESLSNKQHHSLNAYIFILTRLVGTQSNFKVSSCDGFKCLFEVRCASLLRAALALWTTMAIPQSMISQPSSIWFPYSVNGCFTIIVIADKWWRLGSGVFGTRTIVKWVVIVNRETNSECPDMFSWRSTGDRYSIDVISVKSPTRATLKSVHIVIL